MERQVGIIGAGISGILACKYTLSKGYRPIVFESRSDIGGVWTKTMKSTKLQTNKVLYQFSDFSWPPSVTQDFPTQGQVLDYIQSYARHFDLIRHIKFNSKVLSIDYEGVSDEEMQSWSLGGSTGDPFSNKGKWNVVVEDSHSLSTQVDLKQADHLMLASMPIFMVYRVDFVIICVGQFLDGPNIPEFPPNKGPEVFDGKVIHSLDYTAMDHASAAKFLTGKRITVVGFQKSALDIAVECSIANGEKHPCTMLYKTEHWNLPDHHPWGVPLTYLFFNRFSELSVHKPGEGFLLSLLATFLSPVRWTVSKFVESYIKWKVPLAKLGMVPKHSFMDALRGCAVSMLPQDFYKRVEKGSIILKKSESFSFCKDGILVDGESAILETDLVILATGFKMDEKLKHIFSSPTFQDYIVGSPASSLPLYRQCIHPRIPQLGVIGFSASVANLYTSEMRARWIAELLDSKFKLPSIKEMEADVTKWDEYTKQRSGQNFRTPCCNCALHIWYNDQLCKDMGLNPKRKKGFFAELFEPYGPRDYAFS